MSKSERLFLDILKFLHQNHIYYIGENIGELQLQFINESSYEMCNLIIKKDISPMVREELIEGIINTIISNPEEFFVINIFIGTLEGSIINRKE